MTFSKTEDQAEIRRVFAALPVAQVFEPTPPHTYCVGIVQIDRNGWLVGTNTEGRYVLYFLDHATKEDAFGLYDRLVGKGGAIPGSARVTLCGTGSMAN